MSSSSFPLPLNPPLPLSLYKHKPHVLIPIPFFSNPHSKATHICFSSSSSSDSQDPDRNELLWLREEQRWLREEQRWLREERRWIREREGLMNEVQSLKLRIQSLERRIADPEAGVTDVVAGVSALLDVLKEKNLIAGSGGAVVGPMLLEQKVEEVEEKKVVSVSGREVEEKKEVVAKTEKRKALRTGSEGEAVREMQEALQKLGFYSGEEDMEYSSFSSGTERAVRTWQATLGAREDGIMTEELLEILFTGQQAEDNKSNLTQDQRGTTPTFSKKEGANGAAVSLTEITEVHQEVVKEEGVTEVEVSAHRVFLLGENRWEEPSRLGGRGKVVAESRSKGIITKCLSCRGEGRLLCTECDGTGEPNVEPQFLEWIEEGAKCPYCEGLGYTICDVCQVKATS